MNLQSRVLSALRTTLGNSAQSFPLHEPCFGGNEQRYVQECIQSTFVSSVGVYVDQFEKALASYTGVNRAVAVVNGTAALQVALQLAGVKANDEVIVPALTFVATANAVSYLGATPHFADSNESTLGLDPQALREWLKTISEPSCDAYRNRNTGRRIRAMVPMHTFGHPCDMDGLLAVARDYRLEMVEDAAESLGSFYCGQHTGSFGLFGTLSFNGNKIVTTGGGGAILTNDEHLADYAKHLTTTAKQPHRWEYVHNEIGFNYRMPNINAALGCAQLEQLSNFISSKRNLYIRYTEAFQGLENIRIMKEPLNCESNYWLQTLILSDKNAEAFSAILELTNDDGIMTRPVWRLMHQLSQYQGCPKAPLPVAESLARRVINLPSSVGLI